MYDTLEKLMDAKNSNVQKAGLSVLKHFQNQWCQIRANSEICSKKGRIVTNEIEKLDIASSKLSNSLELLLVSYRSLSQINELINITYSELSDLQDCFDKLESMLTSATNEKEMKDFEKFKSRLDADISWSIKEKSVQSELNKEKLLAEHNKRLLDVEQKQELIIEERRRLFEKAFEEEKSKYLENLTKDL